MTSHPAWVLFFALFGLYSPIAALGSYLPLVRPYSSAQILRLALGLGVNVAVFVLAALWVGEPLLQLLGISTAALTATGGIALAFAAIPLLLGKGGAEETDEPGQDAPPEAADPKAILFTPLTFPLTVGGTTFAFGVAASADATGLAEKGWLSLAAVCFAAVTAATLYASGHVQRRISLKGAQILDRIAGILLTAIATILLANGFTDLVTARLGG
ncbi:MarC family protein [Actinomadura parmotrematis]|uniref:UPF0056 membrane protein n=1 Tax=Actinomadura parmotrematis TaxID=2864039 RepID=A0ABS7FZ67_9ACTN|nr:MarC family protein [Actinomadura parmotrematis]MBW8485734.1 MarC family protein [Actinomadura parmotrematis]